MDGEAGLRREFLAGGSGTGIKTRRFLLDPTRPPELSPAEATALDTVTDAELTAAAESDADNPPLDERMLSRLAPTRRSSRVSTMFMPEAADVHKPTHVTDKTNRR